MKRETLVLIGKEIEVAKSHLKGKVINETKHTITIQTKQGEKKVIKKLHSFIVSGVTIPGEQFLGRIEERIKN